MDHHAFPISIIVTTYNWPKALDRVLSALSVQDYPYFEVIVADDGSKEETAKVIRDWQARCAFPIIHCWQPDEGFRAAMCRNRAAAIAKYDYLIFLDGDCVPLPHFISRHAKLAEPSYFVTGNRILLNPPLTETILTQTLDIHHWSLLKWLKLALFRQCNRFVSFLPLPFEWFRKKATKKWQGAKTCNLALWRGDLLKVNGFDEHFIGWGFEDSDLVIRLQRMNVQRKLGHFAVPVLHLWHPIQAREQEASNREKLEETLNSKITKAFEGVDQYFAKENYPYTPVE